MQLVSKYPRIESTIYPESLSTMLDELILKSHSYAGIMYSLAIIKYMCITKYMEN